MPRRFMFCLWVLMALPLAFAQTPHINPHLNSRLQQADSAGYYWMPTSVADDYFDGTSSRSRVRRHMQIAREAGAKYLRCAFSWDAIEKSQGHYDWRFWDMLVSESERAGVQLIPYVAYTPEWAVEQKEEFWKQPPRDPELYAEFMYRIASRYRGRIHSWEIWNEPDITEYWTGSVEQFAKLVETAAPAIRRGDPTATVVLAGMSKGPSPFFEELVHHYHAERAVDVVAMHGYPESWLEERAETVHQSWIAQMNRDLAGDGAHPDFWVNEMGYAEYRYSPTQANKYGISAVFPYEHTGDYAAASLFKDEVMALASGRVSLTAWYRIDDFDAKTTKFSDDQMNFHLGLETPQRKLKPTFYALKFFNHLFDKPVRSISAKKASSSVRSTAVVNVFERQDGRIIVVGWLRSLYPSEAPSADGKSPDLRREDIAVELPCSAVDNLRTFNAQGRPEETATTFSNGWLGGIHLRPDGIFVAEMNCATPNYVVASELLPYLIAAGNTAVARGRATFTEFVGHQTLPASSHSP